MGGEFQWGRSVRTSWMGLIHDDFKIQFSFKYNFDYKLGGPK